MEQREREGWSKIPLKNNELKKKTIYLMRAIKPSKL